MEDIGKLLLERRRKWEERFRERFEKIRNKRLRILVELYYDTQKLRIAQYNRLSLYRKFGFGDIVEEYSWYIDTLKMIEDRLAKEIGSIVEEHPLWSEWLSRVKGVGKLFTGCIIAWIDDIERFPNISKLWRYSGYAVIEGKAQRRQRGMKAGYNIKLKTLFYKIGVNLVRAKGRYYELYKEAREYYENRDDIKKYHEELAKKSRSKTAKATLAGYKKHIHMMALRRMIKIFISHCWTVWREAEGLPVTKPYPIEILGHKDYIPPLTDE